MKPQKTFIDIGFTGTQNGATFSQLITLIKIFKHWRGNRFHNGQCIGADEQSYLLARSFLYKLILHPPINEKKMFALKVFDDTSIEVREPKEYLDRDRDIVDESKFLIAIPKTFKEERRSGTWATIRYAIKQNKTVLIIWPDGSLERR